MCKLLHDTLHCLTTSVVLSMNKDICACMHDNNAYMPWVMIDTCALIIITGHCEELWQHVVEQ